MTIDFDSLQEVTPANMLKAVEIAIANLALGAQSYTVHGRTVTKADLGQLKNLRDSLKREVAEAASPTGSMTALGRFGRPQ